MTMEIDALHAGQPMRNSLDPCTSCSEWQAQAERVRVLEADGPQMRRGSHGDGSDWMGSMRECLNDAMQAASVEANLGDEARAEVKQLRERVRVLRKALQGLEAMAERYRAPGQPMPDAQKVARAALKATQ